MNTLLVETRDRVVHVSINRPEKHNALSRAVLAEIEAAFNQAAGDQTLLAAVLRGAGDRSFAAGGDLRDLSAVRTPEETTTMVQRAKGALDAVRRFPVPVVAALNGDALGGGAELGVACDFRVFASHARVGFIHGRLKISTAWGGGTDLLKLVGPATALRLLSRGELVDAATAQAIGLADAVAQTGETLDAALERFLSPILTQSPHVLRAFKALATEARLGRRHDELQTLEARMFTQTWVHDDHWAAVEELFQKGAKR